MSICSNVLRWKSCCRAICPTFERGASRKTGHRVVRRWRYHRIALSRCRKSALPRGSAPGRCCRAMGMTGATFKWSRDTVVRVPDRFAFRHPTVVVENLGRDECLSLKPGDWVEVNDDGIAMGRGLPAVLGGRPALDRDELTVSPNWPACANPRFPGSTPQPSRPANILSLRRWTTPGYWPRSAVHCRLPKRRRRTKAGSHSKMACRIAVRQKRPIQGRRLLAHSGARGHRRRRMAARTRQQRHS